MAFLKRFLAGCAILALFHAEGCAEVTTTDRLIAAGKLWAMAKYFHPALAYRDIDWDSAWVKAYPDLKVASNAQDYERAVKIMLDVLGDPLTTTIRQHSPSQGPNGAITTKWETDSVFMITVPNSQDWNSMIEQLNKLSGEIPKARAVVFDLRAAQLGTFLYALGMSGLEGSFASKPITVPAHRMRLHSGLVSSTGTSGGYYSGFQVTDSRQIQPKPGAKDVSVMFVVGEHSPIPEVALALQTAGNGRIVSEGLITDDSLVRTTRVPLVYGIEVNLRIDELIYPDGTTGITADATVSPGEGLKTALAMVADPTAGKRADHPRVPVSASPRADRAYPDPAYPEPAYRALAALRIWSVYHYFYPYKDLMGEDWDGVLHQFLPKLEAARDAREYNLTVAEMVSHVHDSHAQVDSKTLREVLYGSAVPPVYLRWIENSPVVARVVDEDAAKSAGIGVGDVILRVGDGEAKTRMDELVNYISASTPQALIGAACGYLLGGPDGSTVAVKLRKPNGEIREATLTRKAEYRQRMAKRRTGEIVQILPGNIGYADLDRLPVSMVDEMFERLKNTRAIIFDVRGYPLGTAWAIAPRLTEAKSPVAALFRRPVLMSPEVGNVGIGESVTYTFSQRLPETSKWRYKNRTVMLIDERTISQAEHTGLFFEVANKTKFIGSPTVGANGDVTTFTVPGGIRVNMTGHDVRHADGRQLQRIGLQPDVSVAPTIAGLASGRDEVLERAVEYIKTGK